MPFLRDTLAVAKSCLFLAALFGEEQMEKMVSSSVQQVKTLRANRRKSLGREPELGKSKAVNGDLTKLR